jgi:lipoprotein
MKNYILIGLAIFGISSCAWWNDWKKDIGSDTKGIERTAKIYSMDGKLITEYKGLMRVKESSEGSDRIVINLINENNKRIIIENAIVIIEEISADKNFDK